LLTSVLVSLTLVIAILVGQPVPTVRAQEPAAAAAETAVFLAEREIAADWDGLYVALHPDAQAVVPVAAMAGWYANDFLPRGPNPIEILDVWFVEWTWQVTGVTYPWTAEVTYRQTFWDDGTETTTDAVVHLVESDGGWRWFFGADMAFVAAQIARFPTVAADTPSLASSPPRSLDIDLPGSVYADLDAFWSTLFRDRDLAYFAPGYVAFTGDLTTACGIASAAIGPASYCPLDATIYWETTWMDRLRAEQGNIAWTVVIAHEWGHHLQALLGLSRSLNPDGHLERYPIEMELQADCLSGVYVQDAEWRGLLTPADLSAATSLAFASGDSAGVPWYDAAAHGTPDMRATSFMIGYTEGAPGCALL
jgi:hypothetical protein